MPVPLEFWFDFASTYSYPAAMRLERAAAARGVPVLWRPRLKMRGVSHRDPLIAAPPKQL